MRIIGCDLHAAKQTIAVDLVQIAAEGLTPKTQYRVFLSDTNEAPFKNLQPLAVLKTNPDGAGIVQAIGPVGYANPISLTPRADTRAAVRQAGHAVVL
jgi:hypothetical protein